MKCKKCGYQNPNGAKFCGYCRAELNKESGAEIHQSFYIIFAVLAIAIGIVVGVFLGKDVSKDTTQLMPTLQKAEDYEASLSKEAAEAYIAVLEKALEENREVYSDGDYFCEGLLLDLDGDGAQEFIISNLKLDNSGMGFADAVFSAYDYETGALITRINKQDFGDFGGAGTDFFMTVVYRNGTPMIMTYEEEGDTSGYENELPGRYGTMVVYDCESWLPVHVYEIERYRNNMFFYIDDEDVSEKVFLKELDQYDNVRKNWNDAHIMLEFPKVAVLATGLWNDLYEMIGVDSYENTHTITAPITYVEESMTDNYMNLISAGQYHSVAIYDDGTVCAVGRSDRDRADVDQWKDIIAVSAYSHTVGLRSDGTVVASGDWDDSRCNVSAWSDIIDIDTGEKNTIGLEADGTVHVVGENEYDQCDVTHWSDIVDVAIGSRTAYGVKSNGRVVSAGGNNSGQRNVGGWRDIVAVSAGPYHVVGLQSDGTVVAEGDNTAHQCEVEGWTNIVAITAGNKYTLGLKKDGSVVACGQFGSDDLNDLNNARIVAISAGMNHAIALTEEGQIIAVGNNGRNQCKIDGYDIF